MRRGLTGHYEITSVGGEQIRAFDLAPVAAGAEHFSFTAAVIGVSPDGAWVWRVHGATSPASRSKLILNALRRSHSGYA